MAIWYRKRGRHDTFGNKFTIAHCELLLRSTLINSSGCGGF